MNEQRKSHEALECGHCGVKNRMRVIGSVSDTKEFKAPGGAPCEAGTLYEVYLCPTCGKAVLVSGHWHDGMDDPEDWVPKVLLPEPGDRAARHVFEQHTLDRDCMILAVSEARKCVAEAGSIKPKVGAVVTRDNKVLASGYRGELKAGEHAEFTVLEGKCKDATLVGAVVYTTLEPCTTRNLPKTPCVNHLIRRKVERVVIGMLDPDERIRGRGVLALRKANIRVDLFPPDLMTQLEEMNRDFIAEREHVRAEPITAHDAGGATARRIESLGRLLDYWREICSRSYALREDEKRTRNVDALNLNLSEFNHTAGEINKFDLVDAPSEGIFQVLTRYRAMCNPLSNFMHPDYEPPLTQQMLRDFAQYLTDLQGLVEIVRSEAARLVRA